MKLPKTIGDNSTNLKHFAGRVHSVVNDTIVLTVWDIEDDKINDKKTWFANVSRNKGVTIRGEFTPEKLVEVWTWNQAGRERVLLLPRR